MKTKETVKEAILKTLPNVEDRREIAQTLIAGGFNLYGDYRYTTHDILDNYIKRFGDDVEWERFNLKEARKISGVVFEMQITFFQVQPATWDSPAETGYVMVFTIDDPGQTEYIERVEGADTLDEDPQAVIDAIEYIFSTEQENQ